MNNNNRKAWVVAANMGYGHQRAAYPLRGIARERIISANNESFIPEPEKKMWRQVRTLYEFVSRLSSAGRFGKFIFELYDRFQEISPFYPFRDLSKPDIRVWYTHRMIKQGLCKSLIDYVKKEDLPFVTTFFIPALAAEYWGLKRIYCIVTDTDITRSWVAMEPKKSNIVYLAPTEHTVKRLKEYGVPEKNIILTGFPLPKENLGGRNFKTIRRDVGQRLPNLDTKKVYINRHKGDIREYIKKNLKFKSNHTLTLTYVVGGAGAEKEIALSILKSFKKKILAGEIIINLVAGTRVDVTDYFKTVLKKLGMKEGEGVNVIFSFDIYHYFESFNKCLRTTDILWTKPSELCFYTALGLPLILAPPIGAHEKYNERWLVDINSGFPQEDPEYADEWITDLLESGRLAEGAWEGFLETLPGGTYKIEEIIFKKEKPKQG